MAIEHGYPSTLVQTWALDWGECSPLHVTKLTDVIAGGDFDAALHLKDRLTDTQLGVTDKQHAALQDRAKLTSVTNPTKNVRTRTLKSSSTK